MKYTKLLLITLVILGVGRGAYGWDIDIGPMHEHVPGPDDWKKAGQEALRKAGKAGAILQKKLGKDLAEMVGRSPDLAKLVGYQAELTALNLPTILNMLAAASIGGILVAITGLPAVALVAVTYIKSGRFKTVCLAIEEIVKRRKGDGWIKGVARENARALVLAYKVYSKVSHMEIIRKAPGASGSEEAYQHLMEAFVEAGVITPSEKENWFSLPDEELLAS